jgi:hypothetical protein
VTGAENAALMHAGPASPGEGSLASAGWVTGMSQTDAVESVENNAGSTDAANAFPTSTTERTKDGSPAMPGMAMEAAAGKPIRTQRTRSASMAWTEKGSPSAAVQLNGCLTLLSDGRVMLRVIPSSKTYRLEARPLLFSQNADRVVHVTGRFGSVVAVEDPQIPSWSIRWTNLH